MKTVSQTLLLTQRALTESGSDSPRLDAELLLSEVLDCTRTQLLANLPDPITADQKSALTRLVARRVRGEPMAYILGRREFFGLELIVTPDVLTPRPETELLVEWALAWLADRSDATVVDVGTGSGAIAIAVAVNSPPTNRVAAVDISHAALAVARRNAERHCPDRIDFFAGDLLAPVYDRVDLVLANLPYLRPDQIASNRELHFEPVLALDGGDLGLDLIDRLIDQIPGRLTVEGAVALEIDPEQADAVSYRLSDVLPDARVEIHDDLAGLPRLITAVRI